MSFRIDSFKELKELQKEMSGFYGRLVSQMKEDE
ncbi:hypothetical protein LCGC14_2849100, partial [marine sediment metagenome]